MYVFVSKFPNELKNKNIVDINIKWMLVIFYSKYYTVFFFEGSSSNINRHLFFIHTYFFLTNLRIKETENWCRHSYLLSWQVCQISLQHWTKKKTKFLTTRVIQKNWSNIYIYRIYFPGKINKLIKSFILN